MVSIRAVYENGVFRPLGPIELPEGARVEVIVVQQIQAPDQKAKSTKGAESTSSSGPLVGEELAAVLDQIAALPYSPHSDGRTDISTHHDDILYPKHGKVP
jgi:predicted DNA-binding antitoxin AbrB/MazE fold protein